MTYSQALHILGETRRFGMKLGLESMHRLAGALGRPQDKLRFVHLAGTNGKGSTAAFVEAGLRTAGQRVGLFTSPHLVSIRERVQINREPISEAAFVADLEVVLNCAQKLDIDATFFELMTAMALRTFAREQVDWVVWETGLGGRLDATNIVKPELVILTNIGLDHQTYLGDSLEEIAFEKAGIIKPGVPVVNAVSSGRAGEVIKTLARQKNALILTVTLQDYKDRGLIQEKQQATIFGHDFQLGLLGPHQVANAACAVAALTHIGIPLATQSAALAGTYWPGRFQILNSTPLCILDGAHNAEAAKNLAQTWRNYLAVRQLPSLPAHLVFGSVADKDVSGMTAHLSPLATRVSLVRLGNERTSNPQDLARFFPQANLTCYDSVAALWTELQRSPQAEPILIAGSLFLAGEVLSQQEGRRDEYRWNELLETLTPAR